MYFPEGIRAGYPEELDIEEMERLQDICLQT